MFLANRLQADTLFVSVSSSNGVCVEECKGQGGSAATVDTKVAPYIVVHARQNCTQAPCGRYTRTRFRDRERESDYKRALMYAQNTRETPSHMGLFNMG